MKYKSWKMKSRKSWGRRLLIAVVLIGLVGGFLATTLIKPTKAAAAISYVSSSTAVAGTAAASLALPLPTGVVANQLLIAQVMALPGTTNGTTITPPSGWTVIGTPPSGNKYTMALYSKITTSTEPASYTFSFSPNSTAAGSIVAFSGTDTVTPIDNQATQVNNTSTANVAPSVTANYSTGTAVPFWGYENNTTASSIDAGLTQMVNTSDGASDGITSAYKNLTNAGATGTFTANTAVTTPSLTETVTLKPAVAAAGVQFVAAATPVSCTSACTSMTATAPAGWAVGDMMFTNVTWNGSVTVTMPAGWTQVGSASTNTTYSSANYYYFTQNGDTGNYNWGFSGAGASSALISTTEFTGADASNPIDVYSPPTTDASGSTHNSPTVTTTIGQDMLVSTYGFTSSITATNNTSTTTTMWNAAASSSNGVVSIFGSYELQGVAGTTTTKQVSTNHNVIAMMQSVAIRPLLPTASLITPANNANMSLLPTFKLVSATLTNAPLQYRIQLCSAANCPAGSVLNTFDQTVSQTGWSGQDAKTGTAYTGSTAISGSTVATYTAQSSLAQCTTYYWRGQGYDTLGGQAYNYSATRTFSTNCVPNAPTLYFPSASLTGVRFQPEFKLATFDANNDYVEYRIDLCSTSTCSTVVSTWNQTVSQTGWSGQNANNFTAYLTDASNAANSTAAYYTPSTALTAGQTYWWRAFAIDPAGSNAWSNASAIQSFTIGTAETRIVNGQIKRGTIL